MCNAKERIRTFGEKEIYMNLWVLEVDTIKQVEMKEKISKECPKRKRKILGTKSNSRNLIEEIKTWAVTLVRLLDFS